MPAFDGGDDFVGLGGPCEGCRHQVCFLNEAVDGGLEIDDGAEDAALQSSPGELGEEAFHRVEPGAGGRREVEDEALVPGQPSEDARVGVGFVIVENEMDGLSGGDLPLDGIEEADELLMAVALHAAADDLAFEHIESGEERGRAMAFVIVGQGSGAALLQGQARLGPVERLDLALLVDGEHEGVRRRIDIEADHVLELGGKLGIGGELELADPVRLQPVRTPDALHRADADRARLRHPGGGPVCRLAGRRAKGERHHALGHLGAESGNARGPRLIAQQTREAFLHEAFLPAPDAGLRLAGSAHDLVRAQPVGRQQNDRGPPDMLLSRVAILDQAAQAAPVGGRDSERNPGAHAPRLARAKAIGNPSRDSNVSFYPLVISSRCNAGKIRLKTVSPKSTVLKSKSHDEFSLRQRSMYSPTINALTKRTTLSLTSFQRGRYSLLKM
jgi:hypothetical protein